MTDDRDILLFTTEDMNENQVVHASDYTEATISDYQHDPVGEEDGADNKIIHATTAEFVPLTLDQYLDSYADFDAGGDFSFTGVWHSAEGLLQYVLDNEDSVIRGKVLEIGAGTGWLGINVAQRVGDTCHEMLLTDRTEFWLQANLEEARKQGIPCSQVSCQAMDWSDAMQVKNIMEQKWDLILGSDLIYSEDGVQLLAQTLAIFARSGWGTCKILYAHTSGRMPELDGLWEKELQSNGLAWEIRVSRIEEKGNGIDFPR